MLDDFGFVVGFDCLYGVVDSFGDGEVLMWFCDLFYEVFRVFVECDEVV